MPFVHTLTYEETQPECLYCDGPNVTLFAHIFPVTKIDSPIVHPIAPENPFLRELTHLVHGIGLLF